LEHQSGIYNILLKKLTGNDCKDMNFTSTECTDVKDLTGTECTELKNLRGTECTDLKDLIGTECRDLKNLRGTECTDLNNFTGTECTDLKNFRGTECTDEMATAPNSYLEDISFESRCVSTQEFIFLLSSSRRIPALK
jgi:hypothetical protein